MESIKTLQQAIIHFQDFDNCRKLMVELRWPDGKSCPFCGHDKLSRIDRKSKSKNEGRLVGGLGC